MKKLVCTAVFALIGFLAFAQERIAVFPFEDMGNVFAQNEAVMFFRDFSNEFTDARSDLISVVPRQEIERIININLPFQIHEFSISTKTPEMQRVLNGSQILTGLIVRVGNGIRITASLYAYPEMRRLPGEVTLNVPGKNELFGKIPELVEGMQSLIIAASTSTPYALDGAYSVGDVGPAGGRVFYDKGEFSDGWRYMEVAPNDFTAQWGTYEFNVPGTDTVVGSGRRNTRIIVDNLNRIGERYRAAQICTAMDINGYNDWFLPSKDELDLIYKNLKQKELGGFSNNWYWSSTQYNNFNGAWVQHFGHGNQYGVSKNNTELARAVRAF